MKNTINAVINGSNAIAETEFNRADSVVNASARPGDVYVCLLEAGGYALYIRTVDNKWLPVTNGSKVSPV